MNCLTARQTLELARPDEPVCAPHDPESVAVAARHVAACPACQMAVARQETFDRKVGGMRRELRVPGGVGGAVLGPLRDARRAAVVGGYNGRCSERATG